MFPPSLPVILYGVVSQTDIAMIFKAALVPGILVIVILGGMGRLYGPVAGAIVFIALEEVLSAWTEHWMIFLGPILILVVLYARGGLWGWIEQEERPGA